MRDPVALAWSGRTAEARALARAQAHGDDPFLAAQGLEALAVLGREHGVRADAGLEALLVRQALAGGAVGRKAFDAAMGLEARALEGVAAQLLRRGEARWEVLRYAGELPSLDLARALADGWAALPPRLRDEALLTSCAMPCATPEEAAGWGRRALDLVDDADEAVRLAALTAVRVWRPAAAARACARGLDDPNPLVRREAARALSQVDPARLLEEARSRGDACPEVLAALTDEQRQGLAKRRR